MSRRPLPRPPFDPLATLRAEVALARRSLARSPPDDASIHAARQALKRARAALRLLREAIPEARYAGENARLRDAARPLAPARDARVMLGLAEEFQAAGKLRSRLRAYHDRCLARLSESGSIAGIRRELERSLRRIARWRLAYDSEAPAAGLQRTYRKGRKRMRRVLQRPSTKALHEWRKQTKYLAIALAFAARPGWRGAKAQAAAAELARRLGEDHDLAMLALALRRAGADRGSIREVKRRRARLQKRAIKLGRRLYGPKVATLPAAWRSPRRATSRRARRS